MAILKQLSRQKRIEFFFGNLDKNASILEIGAGSGWVGSYLKNKGYKNYIGLDIKPGGADIVGDIKDSRSLPFSEEQFDIIIAFEVIEHVDCLRECHYFLKRDGLLMLTTPLPSMDWLCRLFEILGLNQKRTSPHCNLVDIQRIPGFITKEYAIIGLMGQWGIYRKINEA
jgi:2-polyprenyl-3-methyl-5-hydroxy-6-metoxy-1,4-benzoquinol methylase